MITYEVVPLRGIGPMLLGMSREQVQDVMKEQPRSFNKSLWRPRPVDVYYGKGFQVVFDQDDKVEFIELLSLDGTFGAVYKDLRLFKIRAEDLVALISRDVHAEPQRPEPGYSYVFLQLGLSLWREFVPESDDDPEGQYFDTVGIGTQEYLEKHIIMPLPAGKEQ